MRDLSQVPHHPAIEEIATVLSDRTNNQDYPFFRLIVAYYLSLMAASMRVEIDAPAFSKKPLPANMYAVVVAQSGSGKGKSNNIMANEVCNGFFETFTEYTMPTVADSNITALASRISATKGTNQDEELQRLQKEYDDLGDYFLTFDDGSVPAIKQLRHKLLLANIGALNLKVDEVGMHLAKIQEGLSAYLELYDIGHIEEKLIKNHSDNKRRRPPKGLTPANMLLFGAPSMIFDSSKTEQLFSALLATGYARRCFFAYGIPIRSQQDEDDEATYDRLTAATSSQVLDKWSSHFSTLANSSNHQWLVEMPKDVALELIAYKKHCETLAAKMPEEQEINKAEMEHRFFKTLKLAGVLAFVDQASTMTVDHMLAAMKITEESGKAFEQTLNQDADYMKLARYIAKHVGEVTHPDIAKDLPFYKGTKRQELLTFATAWGYKNHIIIQKSYRDGIDFFSGKTLQKTELDKIVLSHSAEQADNYQQEYAPFDQLHNLTQMPSPYNFATHWFNKGVRSEKHRIHGFNLMICDIDGTANMDQVRKLFSDHIHMVYTTKSHRPDHHRFRLIFPMNYVLELPQQDYREFMENFMTWLPFQIDREAAIDPVRKWATHDGQYHYNLDGELLDVLPFIPKTSRNDDYINTRDKTLKDHDALERFFAQRMVEGSRNKYMLNFALALVDDGMPYIEVEKRVLSFNKKLSNGLTVDELKRTVLTTAAKKAAHRNP